MNVVNDELKEVSNWFKANKLPVYVLRVYDFRYTSYGIKVRKNLNVSLNNTTPERV